MRPLHKSRALRAVELLLVSLLSIVAFATPSSASYRTDRVGPQSLSTKTGSVDSSAVGVLSSTEQPNPAVPDQGVRVFKAAKKGYSGTLTYALAASVDVVGASGLAIDVNYQGDTSSSKRWTFEVRDFARNKWVAVGDTRAATANAWSTLHFALSGDFASYVNPSRQMQVRYSTPTKKLSSRLDLAAISITTYVADAPPPVGGGNGTPTDHVSVRSVFKGSFTSSPEAIQYVATVPDLHVLSMGPSKVQSIKSVNPDVEAYYYFKVGGLHGPATRPPSGDPGWDTVVAEGLLWDGPSGQPVTQTQNGWYYVDIQDPSKRTAWIEVLTEQIASVRAQGWDSVYFDNAGVIEPSLINEYPSDYADAAYYAAVEDIMASIRAAFPGMHIVFNSYSGWAAPGQRGLELLDHADGMFFEGFSLKVSGKYFDTARYLQNLDDFASVVASGRKAVAMDYLASTDIPRRTWSLASYLLVNGATAYHYLAGTDASSELQQYPEDQLDIGEPTTDAVVRADGLVVRTYDGATVIVNPSTKSVSYALGNGTFQQLVVSGGGDFPNPGASSWVPLPGSTASLLANTAMIVRRAP